MTDLPHVVLASSSPRRQDLLRQFQWTLTLCPTDVDESFLWNTNNVEEGTCTLALAKAKEAQKTYPSSIIIGVDTVVSVNERVLGKPKDKEQAKEFLRTLSGRSHKVISGCAVIKGSKHSMVTDTTYVTCYPLTEEQIDAYLQTDIWTDKAGGYAIQGGCGALIVKSIHGCYFNVTGLPLGKLSQLLLEYGVSLWKKLPQSEVR